MKLVQGPSNSCGIGGNGAAASTDGGGESNLPENVGSKSSGGMQGAQAVERWERRVPWLIRLMDLFSGRLRKVE